LRATARSGVTTVAVSNELMHAKRRLRALLREEVRETVADPEALEEELIGAGKIQPLGYRAVLVRR